MYFMIAPLIDIPAGLEEAYYNVVSFLGGNNPDTIILKRGSPARQRYSEFASISLFVKWKSLYNGLSNDQHIAWTDYWITLPFGDHGGENGWPGSGYSAFVYVNAPRYKLGQDLLLDPPSANLIFNGNFNGSAVGWDISGGSYDDHDIITASQDFQMFQDDWPNPQFALEPGATYRLSATTNVTGFDYFRGMIFSLSLADAHPETDGIVFEDVTLNLANAYNDFTVPADCVDGSLFIGVHGTPTYYWSITNISLIKL